MRRVLLLAAAVVLMGQAMGTGAGPSFHRGGKKADGFPGPIFHFQPGAPESLPSVDNLSRSLTINGTTVEPSVWCKADGAGSFTCEYGGGTFTEKGGTASDAPSALIGDTATEYDGSAYHEIDDGTGTAAGTDDLVFFAVVKSSDGTTGQWFFNSSDNGSHPSAYFSIFRTATTMACDVANSSSRLSATLADGWAIVWCAFDKDEASTDGALMYFNQTLAAQADYSAASAVDITGSGVAVGGRADGSIIADSGTRIAAFGMWHAADWFAGGGANKTAMDTIAAEEFQKMVGIWPRIGGSAASTISRASSAYLRNYNATTGVTSLELVTDNWPRVERFLDANGDVVVGLTVEPAVTNDHSTWGSDFSSGQWTKTATTVSTDTHAAPDGTTTADTIAEDGTAAASHTVHDAVFGLTIGEDLTTCKFYKAINRSWVRLYHTGAADGIDVNVSTCTAGTEVGTPNWTWVQSYGDGWCQVCINTTNTSTSMSVYTYIGEGDGDIIFDGQTQDSIAIWGANTDELEFVPTFNESTRAADDLEHDLPSTIGSGGSLVCDLVMAKGLSASNRYIANLDASSTGFTQDSARLAIRSNNLPFLRILDGGVVTFQIADLTGDVADGAKHTMGTSWQTNLGELALDGSFGTADTSGSIPDNLDTMVWTVDSGNPTWGATYTNCRAYDVYGRGLIQ